MSRPTQALIRRALKRAQRDLLRGVWSTLPDEQELERIPLTLEDADAALAAGSRPQLTLRDGAGRRYLFKLAPPEHVAAELLCYRLRRPLRCLHVPVARRTVDVPDVGPKEGLVQPMIPHHEARVSPDPQTWSALACEHLLREHPWEWLLANLDTHCDQYLLVGDQRLPINIDWDHALVDLAVTKLDRFNRRSATVAPIRNLFYSEYVAAEIDGDFYGMRLEARRIDERISGRDLRDLVLRYADELSLPPSRGAELAEQLVARKRNLVRDFDTFVRALAVERREALGHGPQRPLHLVAASRAQDLWQRLAIKVLHDHAVRPALKAYRAVLTLKSRLLGG